MLDPGLIENVSGIVLSLGSLVVALLSSIRSLLYETHSLRRILRDERKAYQILISTKAGSKIKINVDTSSEESVRELLKTLEKDAAETSRGRPST